MLVTEASKPGAASAAAMLIALNEQDERDQCRKHPAYLLDRVLCVDATTGEQFNFQLLDETAGWYWQRGVLDDWLTNEKSVILKARQLGITWLAAGYGLWQVLCRPGTRVLVISINEEEAAKVVNRLWDMLWSLPPHLRFGTEILKPSRGNRPNLHIELKHPNGQISYVTGLPSTKKAGHGETAALVILDEFARHEYAQESWKALVPTTSSGGKLVAISTGNGISTTTAQGDTAGNFFHSLWVSGEESGIHKKFLRWDLHPDRDDKWYSRVAMSITNPSDRAEQFPANEFEAFILTGAPYFDIEALAWYMREGVAEPLYRMRFERVTYDTAKIIKTDVGWVRVLKEPELGRDYSIAADVATGRGADYSAAYVIDMQTMRICAAFHGKLDSLQYAYQLHYLGKWFNTAWMAIEAGGGYGEPVVLSLRDGVDGRPAYSKLYRHRQLDRGDMPEAKPIGLISMNQKNRATIIEGLGEAIRERLLPAMDRELLQECQTFVYRTTNPSPRAQDGTHDDRVMALGIALEMYRQRGHHPDRDKRRASRPKRDRPKTSYPWQAA